MKYLFTLLLVMGMHAAQAQLQLLMGGARTGVAIASMAARSKKNAHAAGPATAAAAPGVTVRPYAYQGKRIIRQRTNPATFEGRGGAEIQALEAALETTRTALLSKPATESFMPTAQFEAIRDAAAKAAQVRGDWNYEPYRQELAFYEAEEARRQKAAPAAPAATPAPAVAPTK
ncbi:hypothetical protein [Hymenobacter persicinus]|uniref:Uncharacterized protein n=1 Tax=Hymenobacter persicinus TaxID=2025506 RepID=A0A4Q5LCB7_9BACT|nr:hypothetical protein [Hymenobacter persicinus]RYU80483.1 hypothetical protein EWM57_08285 [Hymenobacter persicinus]